jgi:hypothetical protein
MALLESLGLKWIKPFLAKESKMLNLETNILNEDFQYFIKALNSEKVRYILVGGYSLIIHGYHRTTGDMDIWVEPSANNYNLLIRSFSKFGLPTHAISLENFLNTLDQDVFTFGGPPMAIDILTKVKGSDFAESYNLSEIHNINDIPVRVIHLNHLKQAKKAAGRFKDLDDLSNL